MTVSAHRRTAALAQAGLVACAVLLVVALLFHRYAPSDWTQPNWLTGDPLEVYARVQIGSEQPGQAFTRFAHVDRLGAPVGADWSAYPIPDKLVFVLTGRLARFTGLIAAVQLAAAAILALNAASFFLTARWLRWRIEWAAALALAFAFCGYNLRWGITLSLGQTFTLPPLVLLAAWSARRAVPRGTTCGWMLLALLVGAWLGLGNPYLAYFAGFVAAGALGLALIRRAPWVRLRPLVIFFGAMGVVFLCANFSYAWARWQGPGGAAFVRSMADYRVYALHPLEWLVPPADHRLEPVARLGRAWIDARHGQGEFFYNYLGLAGLLGVGGMLWRSVRSARIRRIRFPDAMLGLGWITAFGVAGGINTWIAIAGVDLFRAGTRIGIFGVLWALLALGGALQRPIRRLSRAASMVFATALAGVACWEQTPDLGATVHREANARRWADHRSLALDLEKALGHDATIFQLPAVPFPEAGRRLDMPDYEHLLPLLVSDTLRFSYGFLRESPGDRWARHVGGLPAPLMVTELERTGFSALWLDTRGLAGNAAPLATALHALGREELPAAAGTTVRVFRLRPALSPQAPDFADPRLHEPWGGQPQVLALAGWYGLEKEGSRAWRWARQSASAGLWSDTPTGPVRLSFRFGGADGGTLLLLAAGKEIWRGRIGTAVSDLQTVGFLPSDGLTTLECQLEGRTFRPGGDDARVLGFVIEDLAVTAQ